MKPQTNWVCSSSQPLFLQHCHPTAEYFISTAHHPCPWTGDRERSRVVVISVNASQDPCTESGALLWSRLSRPNCQLCHSFIRDPHRPFSLSIVLKLVWAASSQSQFGWCSQSCFDHIDRQMGDEKLSVVFIYHLHPLWS